jgi:hypothetical protein
VERERAGGWTPELAARGLRALRLTSASALDRDISTRPLALSEAAGDRVVVTHGLWKKRRFGMSASLTAADLRAALSALPDTATATHRHALEELTESLHTLSAALYRETFERGSHLDEAFTAGSHAARQLIQR